MSTMYDSIIIGGGLSGLLLTHRLHRAGQRVALLEARESLGGSGRRLSQVEFFPATAEVMDLLQWTRSVSPVPLHMEVREHRPQLYDEGKWRAFAGFGETQFVSVGELGHFSHTHEASLEPGADQLVRALAEQLPVAPGTMSEVTALTAKDGKITEVTVNGDKILNAKQFIFTPHPSLLNNLIEGDALSAKSRSRFAKMRGWTSVTLELHNDPPLCGDGGIRIFTHNAKEFEPVVGRVFGERSLWMTLVPDEREGEHEFIGQCIRQIKRQLKRAWSEGIDGQKEEKIYVQANAFGQHSFKTKEPLRLPELSNLFLASHSLGAQPGTLGSLETARVLESPLTGMREPAAADPTV